MRLSLLVRARGTGCVADVADVALAQHCFIKSLQLNSAVCTS